MLKQVGMFTGPNPDQKTGILNILRPETESDPSGQVSVLLGFLIVRSGFRPVRSKGIFNTKINKKMEDFKII